MRTVGLGWWTRVMRPQRLRRHLVVLMMLGLLPVLVLSFIVLRMVTARQQADVERSVLDTTRAVASAVEQTLIGAIAVMQALATSDGIDPGDLRALYDHAGRVFASDPYLSTINLLTPAGQRVFALGRPFGSALPPAADRGPLDEVIEHAKPAISDLFVTTLDQRPTVAVYVPVLRQGRVKYALRADLAAETFARILRDQRLPADAIGSIVDHNQLFIARSRQGEEMIGRRVGPAYAAAIAGTAEGSARMGTLEGSFV